MQIKFQKTTPKAVLPTKGTAYSAGIDISAIKTTIIPAKSYAMVPTGLNLAYCEEGYWISILMRSSRRLKGLFTEAVIDSDYRGDLDILVFNFGDTDQEIKENEKFAQLIVISQPQVEIEEGDIIPTERGSGKFGSTDQ